MILAVFLFGAMQTAPALMPVEVAAARVSRCGLGRATMREDELLEETVLVIARSRASDTQLTCLDTAADFYTVVLPAPLQPRFDAIRNKRYAAQEKADARAWFAARGLLARFPEYRHGEEAAFLAAAERLCGPDAAGAFDAPHGILNLNAGWVERQIRERPESEASTCLFSAIALSGLPIGFIGNEAAKP